MKLLDLLLQELPRRGGWPEGAGSACQSMVDTEIYFYPDTYKDGEVAKGWAMKEHSFYPTLSVTVEGSFGYVYVSKEQYLQASGEEFKHPLIAAADYIAELRDWNAGLAQESCMQQQRIIELEAMLKAAENNEIDARCHIAELEEICAEAYQVVGVLADRAGVFETSMAVSKVLDNLSEAKMIHKDILPFTLEE